MRPDKVKRHIKEFEDGVGDVVVGIMTLVITEPNASVVGEMDGDSHTVFLPSIIEALTFKGTQPWTTLKN
jgi:hypothetical protein